MKVWEEYLGREFLKIMDTISRKWKILKETGKCTFNSCHRCYFYKNAPYECSYNRNSLRNYDKISPEIWEEDFFFRQKKLYEGERKDWERFSKTGNCSGILCKNCPISENFDESYPCENNKEKVKAFLNAEYEPEGKKFR